MLKDEKICRETEQLVIGSLILESNAILRINDMLKSEMFYIEEHREIYDCISRKSDAGEHIDIITIGDALKNSKTFNDAGGRVYLAKLVGNVCSAFHLETWAEMVFDAYVNRQVMLLTSTYNEKAGLNSLSGNEIILEMRSRLDKLDGKIPLFNSIRDIPLVLEQSRSMTMKRIDTYKNGVSFTGITTGLTDLDNMLGGWQDNDLIVLAARPSIGKTAVAMHFAYSAANTGKNVLIFSMEMKAEKLGDRLILGQSGVDSQRWRTGNLDLNDINEIDTACEKLCSLPIYIDDTSQLSINQIKSSARRMQMKGLCDMVVIDYLQLAEINTSNNNYNRQDQVSIASADAKRIAKELNVPVILLSQLNRVVESRITKTPELADLRDSGAIEQDADVVILIHRPEFYGRNEDMHGNSTIGRGELIVAKHRNGPTGSVYFSYNKSITKIENYKLTANGH